MSENKDLIKSFESEFENMDYPIRTPFDIAPQLTNGSQTEFSGENIDFEAVNILKKLNRHLDESAPNDGFPYRSQDSIIEDIKYALRKEDII